MLLLIICVSGNVCTYSNDYYSQCLPGTASTTTTTKTTTTSPKTTTTTTKTTTTSTKTTTTAAPAGLCLCTAWSQIAAAQANCQTLTLSNIKSPASSSIALTALKPSATVIIAGTLSWEKTPSNAFRPMTINGNGITVKGAPGAKIDGSGQLYWDGLGNGGNPKPGQFLKITTSGNSLFTDLYFLNLPTHGLNVAGCSDTTFNNIYIDNKAGDSPNSLSGTKAAAHNTDGFNVGNSNNILINNATVYNQDDCVVVSDCDGVTVTNSYCHGSHGLSINGGGSSGTHITQNVSFKNCITENNTTPIRIKTDSGGEGQVLNILYQGITIKGATLAGITVIQNYGGTVATNGVLIKGVTYKDISGSLTTGEVYDLECGSGSCQGFTFSNIKITGATKSNVCSNLACP
ncbi:hypothetical protein H072_7651 [Dactylellina haptotyla CBS 200.50]|uniref:endo-polygalacturonase n=1 Tax=Dactylellina haptotyla (strain CBS 200.50) TaxID=1284197 RepID=S8BTG5_DACHA|nr:hypothetical protein H072_7651 [Dactylellina haptotyla CBS 200.50]